MSKINSINNSTESLSIDPGASDSYTQFSINATPKFIIGVDNTDDSFCISQGSSLGTNDCLKIYPTGEMIQPLQSSFCGVLTSTLSNVTGDNNTYNIPIDSEIWDQNSDFNTTTGVFTAPQTGKYLFCATISYDDLTTSYEAIFNDFNSSNRVARMWCLNNIGGSGIFTNECTLVGSVILDMDASDVCRLRTRVYGGTRTVDIYSSGGTDLETSFSGCLIC